MFRCAALLSACLACTAAWAGPKEAVHAAFSKFLAAKSFHATVTDANKGEPLSSMDYVAPDRYRIHSARGPQTIIVGDDAWIDMNGRTMKVPLPVGRMIAQYRNQHTLEELEKGLAITDLGSDSVGGVPAHAYGYTVTDPARADVKLWVDDKSGLPLQIESKGSFMGHASAARVRYSDFDDPSIRIEVPQN